MNIDSLKPIRIEGTSASGPERHMLPTNGQAGEKQPLPEAHNPSAGNTVDVKETDKALAELGQAIEPFNVSLKFTKDAETGTIVVEMIDDSSGETLQQFPNAARLQVAATISKLQGKIFNCQA